MSQILIEFTQLEFRKQYIPVDSDIYFLNAIFAHGIRPMYSFAQVYSRVTSLQQVSVAEFSGEQARLKVYKNGHKNVLAIQLDLVSNIKIWAQFQKIKYIKNQSYRNISIIKVGLLFLYSSMKIFFRKIRLIFDIEK